MKLTPRPFFARFLSGLTILSVTFTQIMPAWALRPEGPASPATKAGLESAVRAAGAGIEEPGNLGVSLTSPVVGPAREVLFPFDDPLGVPQAERGTVESERPVPGLRGGIYVIKGVSAGTSYTRVFSTPVEIDADRAAQVFDITERGNADPGRLRNGLERRIYGQVTDAAGRYSPKELGDQLQKEARAGRDANAAIAAAALQQQGYFCGHFSYPGTEAAAYGPIQGISELRVNDVKPILKLAGQNQLKQLLSPKAVYTANPREDYNRASPIQVKVRLRQLEADGSASQVSDWVELNDAEKALAAEYDAAVQKSEKLRIDYRKKENRNPGNRQKLETSRKEMEAARRTLFAAVAKRVHGDSASFRNYLLEDYLGSEQELRRYLEIARGFRRFDQFNRVVRDPKLRKDLSEFAESLKQWVTEEEKVVEAARRDRAVRSAADLLALRFRIRILQDIVWTIEKEVLGFLEEVRGLVRNPSALNEITLDDLARLPELTIRELFSLNQTLRAMDKRMETRGRDSLGLVAVFTFPDRAAYEDFVQRLPGERRAEFQSRREIKDSLNYSVDVRLGYGPDGKEDLRKPVSVSFIFKTAKLVGRLGDNAAELRKYIVADGVLQSIIRVAGSNKLIHTRWASAGVISAENAHPQSNKGTYKVRLDRQTGTYEMIMDIPPGRMAPRYGRNGHIYAVLNGDIDNYSRWILQADRFFPDLKGEYETRPLPDDVRRFIDTDRISTDTKIIPLVIEEFLARGMTLEDAVRNAVSRFSGTFSIQVVSDLEPGKVIIAKSGDQGLYVGISADGFIPASEQLGFVDRTDHFVKVEDGQLVVIDRALAPTLDNLKRINFRTGKQLPYTENDVDVTELTSRDVDLGENNRFFFVKEVFDAPDMFAATTEGRVDVVSDRSGKKKAEVQLDEVQLPQQLQERFNASAQGRKPDAGVKPVDRVILTGMGTANAAAAAGIGFFDHLKKVGFKGTIENVLATELGKFEKDADLSGVVIFAVTQSGATKDLNDSLKEMVKRGATVIAIVNKRDSDVVFIARDDSGGGVYYTGTGRETEIAVASTKAYYAQVGALATLAMGIASGMGLNPEDPELVADAQELLDLPGKMRDWLKGIPRSVPKERGQDRDGVLRHPLVAAARFWPLRKTHHTIVGDGPAFHSAEEVRIKKSELTYRTDGRDFLTHPKHINLSAEPMIVVLAANIRGVDGGWFRDYFHKQMDNFMAHRAAPIVIVTDAENEHEMKSGAKPRYTVKWRNKATGEDRQRPVDVITVPSVRERFSPVFHALAGHLLAYHTALAINELSETVGEARETVMSAWNKLESDRRFTPAEAVGDNDFHATVRRAFKPLWDFLEDGVQLPGIDDGVVRKFTGMVDVLAGDGNFTETVSYGGRSQPFIDVFNQLAEEIRSELARGIDAIRHQAKFVTVGVEVGGQVVVEEFEQLVGALVEKKLQPETVAAAVSAFARHLASDREPQVVLVEDAYEGGKQSKLLVMMKDRPGIQGTVGQALHQYDVNIVGSDTTTVNFGDTVIQVYTLQGNVAALKSLTAGAEEGGLSAFEQSIADGLRKLALGVTRDIGNWMVTRSGALIGKPGTAVGVTLANIHPSAVLEPGVILVGKNTVVGSGVVVGAGTYVDNAAIRNGAKIGAGSVLLSRPEEISEWRLSPSNDQFVAKGYSTEVGENSALAEGTYLRNFKVGKSTVWTKAGTYPNVGVNGSVGNNLRITTAKIVLASIADGSTVGNFSGEFDQGKVTGPIEVTDFVGRPNELIGQAGRSGNHYVEYVEGFPLPPMVAQDPETWDEARVYRELGFMSSRRVMGNRAIALEFSGTLDPRETQISRITGKKPKEDSGHGILAFGFGGVLGATSKMIGSLDKWNRQEVRTAGDVLNRYDRTYLGHFAVLAPRGFKYSDTDRQTQVAAGEGMGRIGNFSLRGDVSARTEVPAWTLNYAVDVILTQMADEFRALYEKGAFSSTGEGEERFRQFNEFILDAIVSEILELRAEEARLDDEFESLDDGIPEEKLRRRQIAAREAIVRFGLVELQKHFDSGAWKGVWRMEAGNEVAFGSWWMENGQWVNHADNYQGYPDRQYLIDQLVAPVEGSGHPEQPWYPPMTPEDWAEVLNLFRRPTTGSISPQATVNGIVDPTAIVRAGAIIEEGAGIGPGVIVEEGAVVESGANLGFVKVGKGAHIGQKSWLYGVVVAPGVEVGSGNRIGLSMIGSSTEKQPTRLGANNSISLSKVMDTSRLGDGNTLVATMVTNGSTLGNGNEGFYGRVEFSTVGNKNTLNGRVQHANWGDNARLDHFSSSTDWEVIEPLQFLHPDGRRATIHPVVTHGAYVATQGTPAAPVRIRGGAFLAGLTQLEPGAVLDRLAFAKGRVATGEALQLDFSRGVGVERKDLAGVLESPGASFILRFGLSYTVAKTPEADRWAVGFLIEDSALRAIETLVPLLRRTKPLDPSAMEAIAGLGLFVTRDFAFDGPVSPDRRAERGTMARTASDAIQAALRAEADPDTRTPRVAGQYSRLQILQGLRRAVEALDGRWRLRYDPAEKALVFTEGEWHYNPRLGEYRLGEYTWVPAQDQPAPVTGTAPAVPAEGPVHVGFSVGGTKAAVAALTTAGIAGEQGNQPPGFTWQDLASLQNGTGPFDRAVEAFTESAVGALDYFEIPSDRLAEVGVAWAGPGDYEAGIVKNDKIPGFKQFVNLKKALEGALAVAVRHPVTVQIMHDGAAGALTEVLHPNGGLRQTRRGIGIVVGTGIGAGFIEDGKPVYAVPGVLDAALGEVGWHLVRLPSGQYVYRGTGSTLENPFPSHPAKGELRLEQRMAGPWLAARFVQAYRAAGLTDDQILGSGAGEVTLVSDKQRFDFPGDGEALVVGDPAVEKKILERITELGLQGFPTALDFIAEVGKEFGEAIKVLLGTYSERSFAEGPIVLMSSLGENFGKGVVDEAGQDLFLQSARQAALVDVVRSQVGWEREVTPFIPAAPATGGEEVLGRRDMVQRIVELANKGNIDVTVQGPTPPMYLSGAAAKDSVQVEGVLANISSGRMKLTPTGTNGNKYTVSAAAGTEEPGVGLLEPPSTITSSVAPFTSTGAPSTITSLGGLQAELTTRVRGYTPGKETGKLAFVVSADSLALAKFAVAGVIFGAQNIAADVIAKDERHQRQIEEQLKALGFNMENVVVYNAAGEPWNGDLGAAMDALVGDRESRGYSVQPVTRTTGLADIGQFLGIAAAEADVQASEFIATDSNDIWT